MQSVEQPVENKKKIKGKLIVTSTFPHGEIRGIRRNDQECTKNRGMKSTKEGGQAVAFLVKGSKPRNKKPNIFKTHRNRKT